MGAKQVEVVVARGVSCARGIRRLVALVALVLVITSLPLHVASLVAEIGPNPALKRTSRNVGLAAGAENLSWSSQTTPADNQWNDIAWSPELGTANGMAGALQYLVSPGDKSTTGLGIAAVASAALPLSPLLRTRQLTWDPKMIDFNRANLTWWQRNSANLATSVSINLPRSGLANLLSGFESTALGAESNK